MTFSKIIGQDRAISMLRESIARGRLHHALLFSGPRGVGKHRTAQALAARLFCESPHEEDACGSCTGCRQVSLKIHPDMRWETLRTEENKRDISIDQVREVQSFLSGQAFGGRKKVVIIDEAQALSLPAQNAFLKTLEEPPGNSLIVLVSHNASALLPTVRSRCQRVPFAPLGTAEIEEILVHEPYGRPRDEARLIAAYASGSLGAALSADVDWLRDMTGRLRAFLDTAHPRSYAQVADLARQILGFDKVAGPERTLKILGRLNLPLTLLRHCLRAAAGLPPPPGIGEVKTHSLGAMLRATESAYAGWVDLRHNANPSLALESLWLQVADRLASP